MYKRNGKYNAKKSEYNGEMYDSKKEAEYARELDLMLDKGEILGWDRQVRIHAVINEVKVFYLRLDFVVYGLDGYAFQFIDVKGYKGGPAYAHFRLKQKVIKALYGVDIEVV